MTRGLIVGVENHGTIIGVYLRLGSGSPHPIYFDHRPFHNWFRDTGLRDIRGLVGMELEFEEGDDGQQVVGLPYMVTA